MDNCRYLAPSWASTPKERLLWASSAPMAAFTDATSLLDNILVTFPIQSSVAIDNVTIEENHLPQSDLSDRSDY